MGWGKTDRAAATLDALVTRTGTSGQERESSPQARGSNSGFAQKGYELLCHFVSSGFLPSLPRDHRASFSPCLFARRGVSSLQPPA